MKRIQIQKTLYFIKIRDTFYNSPRVYIVTDLMYGGELLDKIREKSLSERASAKIMFVIIKTVEQLHRNSVGKLVSIYKRKQNLLFLFLFF